MKSQFRRRPLVAATAMFLVALSAPAIAENTWTGATNNDWLEPTNWSEGVAPPNGSTDVRINNSANAPTLAGDTVVMSDSSLAVGYEAGSDASLTLTGGAKLTNGSGTIGQVTGSSGHVTVAGAGTEWKNLSSTYVGLEGNGMLDIVDGAKVSGRQTNIGNQQGSIGIVNVAGPGSILTADLGLIVGGGGKGTLNVTNQATVVSGMAAIGFSEQDNTATVNGAGSSWTATGFMVGGFGKGTMNVTGGGSIKSDFGTIGSANSVGSVVVSGEGSTWTNGTYVLVGSGGNGVLIVADHGAMETKSIEVGVDSVSKGVVTVDGGTLNLAESGSIVLGAHGQGTLNVINGGEVTSGTSTLGRDGTGVGAAYINGPDSVWGIDGTLVVGSHGQGRLEITNEGAVESTDAVIGDANGSGVAVIDGMGSTWRIVQGLIVGDTGSGAVTIFNGGEVHADYVNIAGTTDLEAGMVVNGAGSLLKADRVSVGYNVDGNGMLRISDGGRVEGQYGYVGNNYGVGTATVTGAGSIWSSAVNLFVGELGEGTLNITSGGKATAKTGIIGNEAGARGKVFIDGAGSTLDTELGLNIGASGQGALEIRNGGRASSQFASIGVNSDSEGAVRIDGAGSEWDVARSLLVGSEGAGAIAVTNGGRMSVSDSFIGAVIGSTGTMLVDGAGSQWRQGGLASLGREGEASLSVLNGGLFRVLKADVGGSIGTGAILVDGANSKVEAVGELSVYQGSLDIRNGGSAKASYSLIEGPSTAVVDGVGSTFDTDSRIDINGMLTLSNGGTVNAETMILADYAQQHGRLNIGAGQGEAAKAAGTLNVGELKLGDGAGTILFNHTGNVDGSDFVFSSDIIAGVGTGTVIQAGPGTTVLTGNNTYTGATAIDAGTLRVNGSIATSSLTTVKAGATLGGNGTVGNTAVQGTLAPGNSIGTLTVQGNLTQGSGSTYAAELGAGNSSDLVHVTGQATVENGATLRLLGQAIAGSRYTVLTADGGLTGTYQLQDGGALSRFLSMKAAYDGTHAYLDISQVREFAAAARTRNQVATAAGLDRLSDGASLHTLIANMQSDDAARDAYDQLSGEAHANVRGALLEESRDLRDAIGERTQPGGGSFWAQGLGAWGHLRGDGNAERLESDRSGLLLGADWAIGDTGYVGAAAGFGKSSFDVTERRSDTDADSLHVGVYGGMSNERFGLQAGLGYSQHDLDSRRKVGFAGFNDDLNAGYDARTMQAFVRGEVALTPVVRGFAEAAQVQVKSDGFQERGGQAALRVEDGDAKASYATVGLKLDLPASDNGLHLRGSLGWRHRFGGDNAASAVNHFGNNQAFTVYAPQMKRGSFVGEVGVAWMLGKTSQLSLDYAGSAGGGAADSSVQARYAVQF